MGRKRKGAPRGPVPVMVEMSVGRGTAPDVVLRLAGRWATLGFQLDGSYAPVRIRAPREHRESLEAAGIGVVMVRGLLDPEQIATLEREPLVRKVWRDVYVEPFAKPKRRPKPTPRGGPLPPPRPPGPRPPPPRPPRPPIPRPPKVPLPLRPKRGPVIRRRPPTPIAIVDCARTGQPVGTLADVVADLGVDLIHADGFRGAGVVVGMVDGGLTAIGRPVQLGQAAAIPNVVNGWPADWGTTALGWEQHGNMTAHDVLGMAPDAQLWDIRIWQAGTGNPATDFTALVSNAVAGYRAAIDNFEAAGTPHILSNSWGIFDRNNGLEYATNPVSPFTLMVEEALDAGMLVLFSAGNCGSGCAFSANSRCGAGDRGPGGSILGPNGHPRVMTVGAANRLEQWCGFTSQGPAVLPPNAPDKPDFCGIARFDGYFPTADPLIRDFDGATSAATAVAAGVVALLKHKRPTLTQDEAKTALKSTAKDIRAVGFDTDSGAGIIQAKAAYDTL